MRWLAAGALLALALLVPALHDLLWDGPFRWHVGRPGFTQGGIELLAVGLALLATLALARRWPPALILALLVVGAYLRRHHVDLALAGAGAYAVVLLGLGSSLTGEGNRSGCPGALRWLGWGLAGLLAWSGLALVASALGYGTSEDLRRWALPALAAVALLPAGRAPLVHGWGRLRSLEGWQIPATAYAAMLLLGTAARSPFAHGHDSLWYGLRGAAVLAPHTSFFDRLGLVSQVHYYPKLWEVLSLPLSGLGDPAFVIALNVAVLAGFLLTVYALLRVLGALRAWAALGACTIGSIPAVAGNALSAKPDLAAASLLVLAAALGVLWLRGFGARWAWTGLAAAILSMAMKTTSWPYGAVLVAGVAATGIWHRRPLWRGVGWRALAAPAMASAVALVITFRTWWLTGLPTVVPGPLVQLWEALGFELRFPVGLIERDRVKALSTIPGIAWGFLFEPSGLAKVRLAWTSNVWLGFIAVAIATAAWPVRRVLPALLPVVVLGVLFALVYNNNTPGGAPNYYIFPLALGTGLAYAAATRHRTGRQAVAGLALVAIAAHTTLGFASGIWHPGTRGFDLRFDRSPTRGDELRRRLWRQAGLAAIGQHLADAPGTPRSVGYGPPSAMRWLPGRYESLRQFEIAEPSVLASRRSLVSYLAWAEIDYMILPKPRQHPVVESVYRMLAWHSRSEEIHDALYRMVDVSAMEPLPAFHEALGWMHDRECGYRFGMELAPLPESTGRRTPAPPARTVPVRGPRDYRRWQEVAGPVREVLRIDHMIPRPPAAATHTGPFRFYKERLYRVLDGADIRLAATSSPEPGAAGCFRHRIIYDFHKSLAQATKRGLRPVERPWKWSIAKAGAETERYTGGRTLLVGAGSGVSYRMRMGEPSHLRLRSQVGYHPRGERRGRSDGIDIELTLQVGARSERRRIALAPGDGYRKLDVTFHADAGERVKLALDVHARERREPDDWAVWIAPRLESLDTQDYKLEPRQP